MCSDEGGTRDRRSVGGEPTARSIRIQYDQQSSESLSLVVVRAVSAVIGREPTAMEPLYSTVDPEAIERLVRSAGDGPLRISFSYEGTLVSVEGSGDVVITPDG